MIRNPKYCSHFERLWALCRCLFSKQFVRVLRNNRQALKTQKFQYLQDQSPTKFLVHPTPEPRFIAFRENNWGTTRAGTARLKRQFRFSLQAFKQMPCGSRPCVTVRKVKTVQQPCSKQPNTAISWKSVKFPYHPHL